MKISTATPIPPFWQRMPQFFLYPLWGWPLLVIAGLAFCIMLIGWLGPLGVVIGVLVFFGGFVRFAFAVLQQTALGRLAYAQQKLLDNKDQDGLPYKVLGLLLVVIASSTAAASIGRFPYFVVSTLWSLALPASVMILAMSGSVNRALDPSNLLFIVRRIGAPYFGLCGLLFLIPGGIMQAMPLLAGLKQPQLLLGAASFVIMYFSLILFYMMGYVLYQYHQVLDMEVDIGFAAASDRLGRPLAPVNDDPAAEAIGRLIAEGNLPAATQLANEARLKNPERFAFQQRYLKVLLMAGETKKGLDYAGPLLSALLQQGRGEDALELFLLCRGAEPTFAALRVDDIVPLAEAAWKRRLPELAIALIKNFDSRHPQHEDAAASFFLAARILSEHYRQDEVASQFLGSLIERYPESPLRAEAEAYLSVLQRLAPST